MHGIQLQPFFEERFEFSNYTAILRNHSIYFEYKKGDAPHEITYDVPVHAEFDISIEKETGRIEIKYIDNFGSEMMFVYFPPTDLQGMFDFIARGYRIELPERKPDNKIHEMPTMIPNKK